MAHNYQFSDDMAYYVLSQVASSYTTVELVGYYTATPASELIIDTKTSVSLSVTNAPEVQAQILYNTAELKFDVDSGVTVSKVRLKKNATNYITIDFDTTYAFPTLGHFTIPASVAGTSYGIGLELNEDWS